MAYIDLIDKVFINLYDNKKDKADIRNLISITGLAEIEVKGLLIHLFNDGLLRREENHVASSSNYSSYDYWISVKGIVLIETLPSEFETRPYTYHCMLLDEQSSRLEKLEISQQKLMGKLNVVTAWIAGGTIALVLVELLKMALERRWFSCH